HSTKFDGFSKIRDMKKEQMRCAFAFFCVKNDFRFRRTLSAGEAEPPRSLRFLWGLDCLAIPAGVAVFHSNQQILLCCLR
ncbi:hypothetical protein, partial [Paenisporosarcina sp.]|uniref:hypothetical protein n=1 Tax=Paenisporosarcina sp. TaxID=1932001 RepID=UPI003C753F63